MSKQEIILYRLQEESPIFPVVPLTIKRKWMSESWQKHAYKCLPLNIANQYGYAVLCPADFTLDWWGGRDPRDVDFDVASGSEYMKNHIYSYFGEGTFTIHVDFMIKTPEGFSTYIRGVPNEAKKGVKPLDAIVETDWLPFTFTYNFLLTEPGTYTFKKNEPLFVFFPIERNTVENFKLKEYRIQDNPELLKDFNEYGDKRDDSIEIENRTQKTFYQNFYRNGVKANGEKAKIKNHITNLIFGGKRGNIR
jgi:hypothetical protein